MWGCDLEATSNALGVYVGYLRRKTEAAGEARLLHTVRGFGYVLRDDTPAWNPDAHIPRHRPARPLSGLAVGCLQRCDAVSGGQLAHLPDQRRPHLAGDGGADTVGDTRRQFGRLPALTVGQLSDVPFHRERSQLAHLEPPVPFRAVPWRQYRTAEANDGICLARSPEYTPAACDPCSTRSASASSPSWRRRPRALVDRVEPGDELPAHGALTRNAGRIYACAGL